MAGPRKKLSDVQGVMARRLAQSTPELMRERLDQRLHFVPLNLAALEISLGHIVATADYGADETGITIQAQLEAFKNDILNFVRIESNTYKHKINITQSGVLISANNGEYTLLGSSALSEFVPATVLENGQVIGLLFSGYRRTGDSLFTKFLNKKFDVAIGADNPSMTRYIASDLYSSPEEEKNYPGISEKAKSYKKGYDIGHLLSNQTYKDSQGNTRSLATSPQAERIREMLSKLNIMIQGQPVGSQTRLKLEDVKRQVQHTQTKLYQKSTYGPRIEATLSANVQNFLVQGNILIVIIQERVENQYKFGTLVESPSGLELLDIMFDMGFSSSVSEDIEKVFYEYIVNGKANVKHSGKKSFSIQLKGSKPNLMTRGVNKISAPKSRTITQPSIPTTNISSLQILLDATLVDTIKKNMGTGSRRDILNLRSGRFAESVKVERLSQSRLGAITAFYRFMRNPYATFSAGGAQQNPRTRDPKLLISRSIREVAQQLMITKLRSVAL
jgi:hypothetical protein